MRVIPPQVFNVLRCLPRNWRSRANILIYNIDLIASMRRLETDLVLDVGANDGQFALDLIKAGYRGRILSIEPYSDAHDALSQCAKAYAGWDVAPRVAMAAGEGEAVLHVASNRGHSSSLRRMADSHRNAAPEVTVMGQERVPLTTLDKVALEHCSRSRSALLKLDVQGSELAVMKGAGKVLPYCKAINIELSTQELYQGQELCHTVMEFLHMKGFCLAFAAPNFTHPDSGKWLDMNALFVRSVRPAHPNTEDPDEHIGA